jgi:hypothetical protein
MGAVGAARSAAAFAGAAFAAAEGVAARLRVGPCKLAIVVRADCGMSKGKMCAQAAHGAVEA